MKNTYLLDTRDIRRIRHMAQLLEKAVVEIIALKQLKIPETNPFAPMQTDLIEETHFIEQQLDLLEYAADRYPQF